MVQQKGRMWNGACGGGGSRHKKRCPSAFGLALRVRCCGPRNSVVSTSSTTAVGILLLLYYNDTYIYCCIGCLYGLDFPTFCRLRFAAPEIPQDKSRYIYAYDMVFVICYFVSWSPAVCACKLHSFTYSSHHSFMAVQQ